MDGIPWPIQALLALAIANAVVQVIYAASDGAIIGAYIAIGIGLGVMSCGFVLVIKDWIQNRKEAHYDSLNRPG